MSQWISILVNRRESHSGKRDETNRNESDLSDWVVRIAENARKISRRVEFIQHGSSVLSPGYKDVGTLKPPGLINRNV